MQVKITRSPLLHVVAALEELALQVQVQRGGGDRMRAGVSEAVSVSLSSAR
eukprot:SAG31_NODE_4583_length_3118_cov_2.039086_6_plen_51_part_00